MLLSSENEAKEILKNFFTKAKIHTYKRKTTNPLTYNNTFIVILSSDEDVEAQLENFLKSDYSKRGVIKFIESELDISDNKFQLDFLFFEAEIRKKG